MTENIAAAKRTIAIDQKKDGLSVRDLILVAVLIAAGAVLKLTVSSFQFRWKKPNFMIAMYCLRYHFTRPKIYQSVVIGLLVGVVSQIPMLNATPLVNIASEMVGALVCGILVTVLAKVARDNKTCQSAVPDYYHLHLHRFLGLYLRDDRRRRRCSSRPACGLWGVRRHGAWNRHDERGARRNPHPGPAQVVLKR